MQTIIDEVNKFNSRDYYFSFASASPLERQLARFLYTGPITTYGNEIYEAFEKVREHYESQLYGSFSNNSLIGNLVSEFAVFEQFVFANCLPITKYGDFQKICDLYLEGLFLSHAKNDYQTKLGAFDDHILRTLLQYGKWKDLMRWYRRYLKKKIIYKRENGDIKTYISNLLKTDPALLEKLETSGAWQGNLLFFQRLWNACIILSLVDFDKPFIVDCFDKMDKFLACLPKREIRSLGAFAIFIKYNADKIGRTKLQRLFAKCLSHPSLHDEDLFDTFAGVSKKNGFPLLTKNGQFELFCSCFMSRCEKCGELHQNSLFISYAALSKVYRQKLSELVHSKLKAEPDFLFFYMAAIYDIIDGRVYLNNYLHLFKKPDKERPHPVRHLEGEIHYRNLNHLMNLVFIYNLTLDKKFIGSLKGMSLYYDWILDMEHFNYDNFNPLWIIQYPTSYYLTKIFAIPVIRDEVKLFLRKNHQPTLAGYYVQYV